MCIRDSILHLLASATVTALFKVTRTSAATSRTAFITSESLPTPDGSMITRSGVYFVSTSFKAVSYTHLPLSSSPSHPSVRSSMDATIFFTCSPETARLPKGRMAKAMSFMGLSSAAVRLELIFPQITQR